MTIFYGKKPDPAKLINSVPGQEAWLRVHHIAAMSIIVHSRDKDFYYPATGKKYRNKKGGQGLPFALPLVLDYWAGAGTGASG